MRLCRGGKGPRFSGTTGDFAEFHKRDPMQPAFEEGDLVGFGESGLTRVTKGMRQLGVISRQAIVAGSVPDGSADLSGYDTVAYLGRVPVKVRGSAAKHDFLVPSGKDDGTAVAKPGFPSVSVGRALGHAQLQATAGGSGSDWQLVEASVVPPVHTGKCYEIHLFLVRFHHFQYEIRHFRPMFWAEFGACVAVRSEACDPNGQLQQPLRLVGIACGMMIALLAAAEFGAKRQPPAVHYHAGLSAAAGISLMKLLCCTAAVIKIWCTYTRLAGGSLWPKSFSKPGGGAEVS